MNDVQIYKLDDLLIRSGLIAAVVVAIAILGLEPWDSRLSLPAMLWLTIASVAPIAMLVAGLKVRRREKRVNAVWRLLRGSLEVDVAALMQASSFTREEVVAAVRLLNDRGLGHYVWDEHGSIVRDGRLDVRVAHDAHCGTCGAAVAISLSMSETPSCPYCKAPIGASTVNAMRQGTIERLQQPSGPVVMPGGRKRMSIGMFIMLLVLCWPAALVYAIYHNR
jgi:hypothetical protein